MENRYLFRGKRIDTGEWVYGLPSCDEDGEIEEIEVWSEDDINFYSVDPTTICQCTGVCDKNGKMIFKNDICSYYNPEDKDGIGLIDDDFVSWIKGTIYMKEKITPLFYLKCSAEWEIIGNMFDNPEILEV